eukprot:1159270-Pelagomonas_calceolata.AAC.3
MAITKRNCTGPLQLAHSLGPSVIIKTFKLSHGHHQAQLSRPFTISTFLRALRNNHDLQGFTWPTPSATAEALHNQHNPQLSTTISTCELSQTINRHTCPGLSQRSGP